MTPVGVRGDSRSEAAMMAPTAKATDVKNPKTFCSRVRELYILGENGGALACASSGGVGAQRVYK